MTNKNSKFIIFILICFSAFLFLGKEVLAANVKIGASTTYFEYDTSTTCISANSNPGQWGAAVDYDIGYIEYEGEMSFNLASIPSGSTISSASICSYAFSVSGTPTGYIQGNIGSSSCSAAPSLSALPTTIGSLAVTNNAWNCISLTSLTGIAGGATYYARWWGNDLNGGTSPFACFRGPGDAVLTNCGGSPHPAGASDCRPYINITYDPPPTISAVSDSPDSQCAGSATTFSSTASDADSQALKLYVCKDSSCTNCGPAATTNCWAVTGTAVHPDPAASYTCPAASCNYAVNNYWAKVCDTTNLCSSIIQGGGGSFTCQKENLCSCSTGQCCSQNCSVDYDGVGSFCCQTDYCAHDAVCSASNTCAGTGLIFKCAASGGSWINHCTNGIEDCDEEGADCGGSCGVANPALGSVSDSPDPQSAGGTITFSAVSSDCNIGDTHKLYICSDSSCANCGPSSQTGCHAYSATGSTVQADHSASPSAVYTCLTCASEPSKSYWAKVCDQEGLCSSILYGGIFTCNVSACNMAGWAWAENIGWISFSCANQASYYLSWNTSTGIMSGYAWSETIGWVSFNCADNKVCSVSNQFCVIASDCPSDPPGQTCVGTRDGCALVSNYKVTINTSTGVLSGYAWSDSLGWLSFNETGPVPGNPDYTGEGYTAKKVGSKITGWAKFLVATNGWDGWVKFSCYDTECTTSNYSTFFSGTSIGGWAWGSDVVGWLYAGGVCSYDYGVGINTTDYTLSGYAWSENLGWLSFNKANTGIPPVAPFNDDLQTYIAKFDTSTCKLRGWARFLSYGGGWDGWVKLQREGGSPDYGVSLEGFEFKGWAWAD